MLATRSARAYAVTGAVSVLVLVLTWMFLVSPRRTMAADLQSQAASAQAQEQSLRTEVDALRAAFANLPAKKADLLKAQEEIPPTPQIEQFTRSINAIAVANGVDVRVLAPGAGTAAAGTAAAPAVAPTHAAADLSGAGYKDAAGAAPTGASGPISIPFTLEVKGQYFQVTGFMKQMQTGMRRAMVIDSINIERAGLGDTTASATSSTVKSTIAGKLFFLPPPPAPVAGAAPAGAGTDAGTTPGGLPPGMSPPPVPGGKTIPTAPGADPSVPVTPGTQSTGEPG